jgi:hypothetical protein
MATNYNWPVIRAEWETGKFTMKELSNKHGFNENYGHRKASEHKWEKGASKETVRKEAVKRVIERIGKTESDIKYELYKLTMMIESKMSEEWDNKDNPNFDILKSTKISTEILQNIMGMKFDLLGIQKAAKKIEHSGSIESKVEYIEKYLNNG